MDYVKTISFKGNVDDYGSITLNGSELINLPAASFSYYDYPVSGTIPVSLFKKKTNTVTLYSHDNNLPNCNLPNNRTGSYLLLKFSY